MSRAVQWTVTEHLPQDKGRETTASIIAAILALMPGSVHLGTSHGIRVKGCTPGEEAESERKG